MARRVVLVCGPPGAGKTTYARSLGLDVYDIDDPQWGGNERMFRAALTALGLAPDAQAVVIRSGATRLARSKVAATINATEVQVLDIDVEECIRRVVARKRPRPPLKVQIAAIKTWWDRYEPGPVVPIAAGGAATKEKTAARGYGARHKHERAKWKPKVHALKVMCWRCGILIVPDPSIRGEGWDVGHDDHDRSMYQGPEHVACNRATAGRRPRVVLAQRRRWRL